ncbi:MAG TPA: dienelactone hydrolase family protein [Candidatus Bathyarchaeia archaeon]|nr:dienelactone hydrolase family protein [Candidatus Bathyarchaeia archaeon]
MKKRSDLIFKYVFFIIACFVLSTINTIYKVIPLTHAQTNADVLSTNNNSATNGTMTNTAPTTNGLQINKVKYYDNVSGYLVYPSASAITINSSTAAVGEKLPAVIMIHEYWGLNDNIKNMARTLAKQAGYVVLAVDLFEGQSTKDPNQARQLMKSVIDNPQGAISNLQAAVKYVSSLPFVNSSKIASVGWCFGGGQSLQLALHSEQLPLAATVLYYGTPLVTDKQELSKIKWPVLGIFGDHDLANPLPLVNTFKAALNNDGITNEIIIYKGLGHAFANPSGANYAPQQTADAWQKTLKFLSKNLSH